MSQLKLYWDSLKGTFIDFFKENSFQHSAATAFYTIFSLPGVAIISVWVAGSFYDDAEVRVTLLRQVRLLVGEAGAEQVELVMQNADVASASSLFMQIAGIVILLISTTTVFISLQSSLNAIWRIKPKPKRAIAEFILKRLLSLAMVASIGFLILVSLSVDTMLALLRFSLNEYLYGYSEFLIVGLNFLISAGITICLFALIYKVLPDAQIRWKDVWTGAIVTTILFVIGKYLIGIYIGTSDVGDAYGAAGSLVALLAWVYYSVMILFLGAHFTYVHTRLRGHKILPNKEAVAIEVNEIERGRKAVT